MGKVNYTYNYIKEYLIEVQSKGRYAISLKELREKFNVSEKALNQNLFRLKSKNRIAQIRKEFYIIIPPQYSTRSMIPASLFIDDMMKYLERKYYVGLFSAAALHGAAHQQPMEFYVVTKKPALRNIENHKLSIRFFVKNNWEKDFITEKKTEAGYLNVSTPELTAFDLVFYHRNMGGLNRIIAILEDLADEMKPNLIERVARNQNTPTIQRLGYLLNLIGKDNLANSLYKIIKKKKITEMPLSLVHKTRTGDLNEKWKLIINSEIERQ